MGKKNSGGSAHDHYDDDEDNYDNSGGWKKVEIKDYYKHIAVHSTRSNRNSNKNSHGKYTNSSAISSSNSTATGIKSTNLAGYRNVHGVMLAVRDAGTMVSELLQTSAKHSLSDKHTSSAFETNTVENHIIHPAGGSNTQKTSTNVNGEVDLIIEITSGEETNRSAHVSDKDRVSEDCHGGRRHKKSKRVKSYIHSKDASELPLSSVCRGVTVPLIADPLPKFVNGLDAIAKLILDNICYQLNFIDQQQRWIQKQAQLASHSPNTHVMNCCDIPQTTKYKAKIGFIMLGIGEFDNPSSVIQTAIGMELHNAIRRALTSSSSVLQYSCIDIGGVMWFDPITQGKSNDEEGGEKENITDKDNNSSTNIPSSSQGDIAGVTTFIKKYNSIEGSSFIKVDTFNRRGAYQVDEMDNWIEGEKEHKVSLHEYEDNNEKEMCDTSEEVPASVGPSKDTTTDASSCEIVNFAIAFMPHCPKGLYHNIISVNLEGKRGTHNISNNIINEKGIEKTVVLGSGAPAPDLSSDECSNVVRQHVLLGPDTCNGSPSMTHTVIPSIPLSPLRRLIIIGNDLTSYNSISNPKCVINGLLSSRLNDMGKSSTEMSKIVDVLPLYYGVRDKLSPIVTSIRLEEYLMSLGHCNNTSTRHSRGSTVPIIVPCTWGRYTRSNAKCAISDLSLTIFGGTDISEHSSSTALEEAISKLGKKSRKVIHEAEGELL